MQQKRFFDDILAVGAREDISWFVEECQMKSSVKASDVVSVESGREVLCLKKSTSFVARGSQRGGIGV